MFAELVINIEAALEGTFHYHVPFDLKSMLKVGHLVEVEFGSRLAQGILIAFSELAPVEDTKPVISLIDELPVVQPWHIQLAQWMSQHYLAPLNGCLRLFLPPGVTRWADMTLDINPYWQEGETQLGLLEGTAEPSRLTDKQRQLFNLLREKGDMRGRQIAKALPNSDWETAAYQLVKRGILRRASVLDAPRVKPKEIRTAALATSPEQVKKVLPHLGKASKQADVLLYLLESEDPLPPETAVLAATTAAPKHLQHLADAALITRTPAQTLVIATPPKATIPAEYKPLLAQLPAPMTQLPNYPITNLLSLHLIRLIEEPATIGLAIPAKQVLGHILHLRGAATYHRILTLLAKEGQPVPLHTIYSQCDATLQHLRKLEKLGLIRFGAEEVWRDPLADRDFTPAEAPPLTIDQARAWGRVKVAMIEGENEQGESEQYPVNSEQGAVDSANHSLFTIHNSPFTISSPFLLHGVTGSGKTEIYMRAIDYALQEGKTAIVLVPEIALTPQTVRRFAARFPGRVAVLHSRLTDGERYDTWRRARLKLFDIVVGPRSALFTPLPNLGVIILDEEHDPSYKQTPPVPPPYYHARETAVQLGHLTGATVIMGSATPDIVTYHRARAGRYQLLELPKRVMGHRQRIESQSQRLHITSRYQKTAEDPDDALTIPLPPIQVVDLRQELRAGNRSIFSRPLEQAITETLERQEQAILFLNRRGTSTFVICRDCGYIAKCPRCDMPLTYHRPRMTLVCHHCGRREQPQADCPQCASKRIRYFGLGTEEVETQVQQRWPQARLTRWDRDTTAGRNTHEQLLASFINQEADILIGTQMIAKGLDLPLVTLVGVISADVSLGLPDYRTGERAFQVLAQVAGRAGRGLLGGRVIIQTYQPEHYAIQAAAEHDYASFYIEEIRFRTQHSLPPFRRMARLMIVDPVDERAKEHAEELAKGLRLHIREKALVATEILGPVPPFFNRIDGRFRWQIIVRSPDPARLLSEFPIPKPWMIDIDPVSTL